MFTLITMMSNRGQPYVPWKGSSANNAVPSWSRPPQKTQQESNGPDFKARPIKHWRKQLIPTPYSGSSASSVGMPFNRPGSEVFLGRDSYSNCESCADTNVTITKSSNESEKYNTIYNYNSDKYYDENTNKPVCVACNPEANVIKPSTTMISKKYYSDRASYLKSRCKQYTQNLSGVPNGSSFNTNNCCKVNGTASTLIYKPNNVNSSDRLTMLKMNTINKNGQSFTVPFGKSAASAAGFYRGDDDAPYSIKSKNQQNCIPFHRNGNMTVCL